MSKQSRQAALRALTRKKIASGEEYVSAVQGLEQLDDRSYAITQGAMVELAIRIALLRGLRALSGTDEAKLFDGYGPMSSFSAKIDLGYALNVFGPRARSELERIKDIRNAFAHSTAPLTFDQTEVTDVCRLLWTPTNWKDINVEDDPPRWLFMLACHYLWSRLVVPDGDPPLP